MPTPGLALSLPTLDPVIPDPGLIERILSGVVLDASTGETIAGAVIRLDRHPAPDLVTESADAGQFEIAVEGIPDTAAITASAPGYIPQSLNVTENDIDNGVRLTFTLKPIDSTVIALEDEPLVRHLGNDEFSGSSNSRFQRESEGVTIVYRFRLNAEQIELIAEPAIAAMFKGVDVENPVFINGQRIDVLDDSPRDGTFDEQVLVFDADLLRRGVNRLRIEATSRPGTDIDDFELVNPRLLLQADGDTLAIRGIVVDAVTGKPLPAATVRLDRAGAPPLSAVTTGAGSFRIRPGDDLPDQFAVVASHPGYVAGVAAVARDDIENGRAIRIALEPASPLVISMEDKPVVHHLGNDEFDGQINSRFQRTSEGIDKTFTFAVPRALPRGVDDLGRLQLWVKGKERPADLSLNGEVIGKIQSSNPDGSFGLQSIAFPANLLRPGPNTLMIQSRRRSGDVDDFEYVDIRIVILPGGLEVF